MRECPDIGFLHHVLGFTVIAQDSAGAPVKPAIVRLHDRANGWLIALAGAPDQFGLSAPDGSYWRCLCGAHDDFTRSGNTGTRLDAAEANRFPHLGKTPQMASSSPQEAAFAAARPALRPENRQPPRKVPSSER